MFNWVVRVSTAALHSSVSAFRTARSKRHNVAGEEMNLGPTLGKQSLSFCKSVF
jgi:hypothetical protein